MSVFGGLFGNSSTALPDLGRSTMNLPGNQQFGTAIVTFRPPQEIETQLMEGSLRVVNTRKQCITFMTEYAEKSLEELRIEDYSSRLKPKLFNVQSNSEVAFDYEDLMKDEDLADFTFVVDGENFKVHKAILASKTNSLSKS